MDDATASFKLIVGFVWAFATDDETAKRISKEASPLVAGKCFVFGFIFSNHV